MITAHTELKNIQGIGIFKVWNQDKYFYHDPFVVADDEIDDREFFDTYEEAEQSLINLLESALF